MTRGYTFNGLNQYSSAGGAAFCHDANGNLTADGGSVYLYDIENRLVEKRVQGSGNGNCAALSYAGTLQAELRYDPTGRLYQVTGGALGTQRFAYDGNAMIAEYNASGTMLRRYVHGSNAEADDPLVWYEGSAVSNSTRRYLHADPRGSIVAVTQYQGTSTATNSYDEYGIPDSASGNDIATKGRFRYTGQAWIPELGMYYYKARIYSPTLGRFLQTDPIGYDDQFNLYAYVANDPINGVDPTGLICTGSHITNDSGGCRSGGGTISGGLSGGTEWVSGNGSGTTANAGPEGENSQGTPGQGHNGGPQSDEEGDPIVVTGQQLTIQRISQNQSLIPNIFPRIPQCIQFSHLCLEQPGDSRETMRICRGAEKICERRAYERRLNPANDFPPRQSFELCHKNACFYVDHNGRVRAYDRRFVR